jgi:hypothetical protein
MPSNGTVPDSELCCKKNPICGLLPPHPPHRPLAAPSSDKQCHWMSDFVPAGLRCRWRSLAPGVPPVPLQIASHFAITLLQWGPPASYPAGSGLKRPGREADLTTDLQGPGVYSVSNRNEYQKQKNNVCGK